MKNLNLQITKMKEMINFNTILLFGLLLFQSTITSAQWKSVDSPANRCPRGETCKDVVPNGPWEINGYVGIGTYTPTEKLEVTGNIKLTNFNNNILMNRGRLSFVDKAYDRNHSIYNNFKNVDGEGSWDGMKFNVFEGASFRVGDANNNQHEIAMQINRAGAVSIGTANPGDYKLAVNGVIGAHDIDIRTKDWAGFVFDENYTLKSLKQVGSFIKQNGHLPDVPSEEDVQENGINVSEMFKIQMQKIEELTLYVIELEEKISK